VPEVAPVESANTGAETFSIALSAEIYPPSLPAIVAAPVKPAPVETREPLTLSTGRTVQFTRMANGATAADLECGSTMSESEHAEYLSVVAPRPVFAAPGSAVNPSPCEVEPIVEPSAPALALAEKMRAAVIAKRAAIGQPIAEIPREVSASVAFLARLECVEPARIVPAPADTFAEAVLVAIRKAADDIACLIRMGWDRAQAIADTREVSTLGTRSWQRVLSLIVTHGTALAIASR